MQLLTLGLNHRTAPVELREQLAFAESRVGEAAAAILDRGIGSEAAVLSTCNRAEIYLVARDGDAAVPALEAFLSEYHRLPREVFHPHLYRRRDRDSSRHLFRVASGVDSMVLGESQILAQVRTAFEAARTAGAVKLVLDELFRRALNVGKRSRTETDIGRGALSVGSAAVELAKTIFGQLDGRTVLILGAGKMSELTVRHLIDSGARHVIVANRTHDRALELARQFGGRAVPYQELTPQLLVADIVIASTAAPHFVLTTEAVSRAMRARRGRPLFLIDIAVPRDIEPGVNDLDNAFLYNIDDLQEQIEQNRGERVKEVARVEGLIEIECDAFEAWRQHLELRPLLTELARKSEEVQARRLGEALARLPNLTERERELVRGAGKAIANELLHGVFTQLRNASRDDGYLEAELVRRLFLEDDPDERSNP